MSGAGLPVYVWAVEVRYGMDLVMVWMDGLTNEMVRFYGYVLSNLYFYKKKSACP